MKPLVIIGCGSVKALESCDAAEMYQGPLFKAQLAYARTLTINAHIRILSAKYGFVDLIDTIEPYDVRWGEEGSITHLELLEDAKATFESADVDREIILLMGQQYALSAMACITVALGKKSVDELKFKLPLARMPIGRRLQWLKEQLK